MGYSPWKPSDWDTFTTKSKISSSTKIDDIFNSRSMKKDFDPKNIKVRESVDSDNHPNSTAIVVALDVTGSMGIIPEELIKGGLSLMVNEILERKPVSDPHLMFMAVGDAIYDRCPLQVTQFESDIRMAEQLKDLYLERGGGGNDVESYNLPWYFAARKTAIDCFEKRGEKGILFTIGDEGLPETLSAQHVKEFIGDDIPQDISSKALYEMISERYDVFHLIIQEGSNYNVSRHKKWTEILGERAISVSDYTKVPEIIVSTLEVLGGRPKNEVVASWDGSTAVVVKDAIKDIVPGRRGGNLQKSEKVWRPNKKMGM